MSRWLALLVAGLCCAPAVQANGLLIPSDRAIPPLALQTHEVKVHIVEQVATTRVTQVFRNHTDRALEATYIFPVPRGASVNQFAMWVDGKEVKGELVEADRARQVYTDIVRRLQDPGLLEYVGNNLLKVRIFPVPARGDQKVTVSFTAINASDSGLIEYVYPLRNDKTAETQGKFSIEVQMEARTALHSLYSPTHPVKIKQPSDRKAQVVFESEATKLDKDFQLYYSLGGKDVGLTSLAYRPHADKEGTFLLLISPRAELAHQQQVARDVVFVLDTSGSMSGDKMKQARKAVQFCLAQLGQHDRFAVLNFATTVNQFRQGLTTVSRESIKEARQWVEELQAQGGTAIDAALTQALQLRPQDEKRTFTIVFFTDGQPTVGENDPDRIAKRAAESNTASTRIFTFGVGDDVNAAMLDKLAEQTRSVSTYVRPEEDIEAKVSGMYGKISHPVLTNLKLTTGAGARVASKKRLRDAGSGEVRLSEMYPNELPDLFHGGQLIVLGRYKGKGHTAITLTGKVGEETKEFVYEVDFPETTGSDRAFVENLWARRKVGYLLDEIRSKGTQQELVDEVVVLAKKHGIATPYTSYLVVPDAPAPVPVPVVNQAPGAVPPIRPDLPPVDPSVNQGYAIQAMTGGAGNAGRINYAPDYSAPTPVLAAPQSGAGGMPVPTSASIPADLSVPAASPSASSFQPKAALPQAGRDGVEMAVQLDALRRQTHVSGETRQAAGRTCRRVNGVWIDTGYESSRSALKVKALSEAYFHLLTRHPELKEVFQLGTEVIWMTPSGQALIIQQKEGCEKLSEEAIDALFVIRK